jgi:putative membrane protein
MSYLVDGLRITISGGVSEHLQRDALVLAAVLATLTATEVTIRGRRVFSVSRLKPALQI